MAKPKTATEETPAIVVAPPAVVPVLAPAAEVPGVYRVKIDYCPRIMVDAYSEREAVDKVRAMLHIRSEHNATVEKVG